MQLQQGTLLQGGKYIIKSKISQESLYISYQAVQTSLNRIVVIREFCMRDFCSRDKDNSNIVVGKDYSEQVDVFKMKFLSDAKANAKGETGSDIKVFDVFEENNTAYYVFLGTDEMVVEEPQEPATENEVITEETHVADNIQKTEDEVTTIELKSEDIHIAESPKENNTSASKDSAWAKNKTVILICAALVIIGFGCASIYLSSKSDSPAYSAEAIDSIDIELEDTIAVDSIVYESDYDMQGEEETDSSQQKFDEYIARAEECLAKAQSNLHKPSCVQNILNARFFYYDKADKINVALKGERLPAHKEIDEITEQEYQYWVSEAKKCGSARSKYEQKRIYLERARSLAFKHQNMLDAQIKWLDDRLEKKNSRRRR